MRYRAVVERLSRRLTGETGEDLLLELQRKGHTKQAMLVISAVLRLLAKEVQDLPEGEGLTLPDFGRFQWKARKPKPHYNAASQQMELIPAKQVLTFTAAPNNRREIDENTRADSGRGAGLEEVGDPDRALLHPVQLLDELMDQGQG